MEKGESVGETGRGRALTKLVAESGIELGWVVLQKALEVQMESHRGGPSPQLARPTQINEKQKTIDELKSKSSPGWLQSPPGPRLAVHAHTPSAPGSTVL